MPGPYNPYAPNPWATPSSYTGWWGDLLNWLRANQQPAGAFTPQLNYTLPAPAPAGNVTLYQPYNPYDARYNTMSTMPQPGIGMQAQGGYSPVQGGVSGVPGFAPGSPLAQLAAGQNPSGFGTATAPGGTTPATPSGTDAYNLALKRAQYINAGLGAGGVGPGRTGGGNGTGAGGGTPRVATDPWATWNKILQEAGVDKNVFMQVYVPQYANTRYGWDSALKHALSDGLFAQVANQYNLFYHNPAQDEQVWKDFASAIGNRDMSQLSQSQFMAAMEASPLRGHNIAINDLWERVQRYKYDLGNTAGKTPPPIPTETPTVTPPPEAPKIEMVPAPTVAPTVNTTSAPTPTTPEPYTPNKGRVGGNWWDNYAENA